MSERIIGLLGGMGPAATVDLMRRIVQATPASDDIDHLRILVDSNPKVPSRIAALIEGHGESPAPCLIDMARGLEAQGADLLAIACNTAHHYHAEISEAVDAELVSIVDVAAEFLAAQDPRPRRIGLLGSSALELIDLYGPRLARQHMEVLYPPAATQKALMDLIRRIKAGDTSQDSAFRAAVESLREQGAEILLIACTELSALAANMPAGEAVFDTAQLLAEALVRRARTNDDAA